MFKLLAIFAVLAVAAAAPGYIAQPILTKTIVPVVHTPIIKTVAVAPVVPVVKTVVPVVKTYAAVPVVKTVVASPLAYGHFH